MRKILCFVFFIQLATAFAQHSFEGYIEMKMSAPGKPDMGLTKMYFSPLGGRLETEVKISPSVKPFKSVRFFKAASPDVYYVLNESAASYSVTDFTNYKPSSTADKDVTVKVIGKEKILGYTCTHVILSSKSGETEMWISPEIMDYSSYKSISESDVRSRNSSFAKALKEAQVEGFPIRTVKRDVRGGEIIIELVKVEKKSIDKNLFEVPTTYTQTESPSSGLEGVMQEMKQMEVETSKEE